MEMCSFVDIHIQSNISYLLACWKNNLFQSNNKKPEWNKSTCCQALENKTIQMCTIHIYVNWFRVDNVVKASVYDSYFEMNDDILRRQFN